MTATILRGDARALPLADESVDLVCTSPPYWALRSYQDQGEHYDGQIGAEASPGEYVDALVECTLEWMRVLKPSGSIFVNLGDKYANKYGGPPGYASEVPAQGGQAVQAGRRDLRRGIGVREKSLLLLPERYRIACVDRLGLIARAVVIWSKPNGLPESVTDRVRRSHEDWVHLVKEPRYYSAVDEIREAYAPETIGKNRGRVYPASANRSIPGGHLDVNPLGKLPGSVWTIATQPLKVPASLGIDHFAAYPIEWPRRIISGWSPSGICVECGEGRRPVSERASLERHNGGRAPIREYPAHHAGHESRTLSIKPDFRITGYACACPEPIAPTHPSVVLDPFSGTGTTALVASVLGRHGISVDASADYCRLATWRTTDPGERARVIGAPKPAAEAEGQAALFELTEVTP